MWVCIISNSSRPECSKRRVFVWFVNVQHRKRLISISLLLSIHPWLCKKKLHLDGDIKTNLCPLLCFCGQLDFGFYSFIVDNTYDAVKPTTTDVHLTLNFQSELWIGNHLFLELECTKNETKNLPHLNWIFESLKRVWDERWLFSIQKQKTKKVFFRVSSVKKRPFNSLDFLLLFLDCKKATFLQFFLLKLWLNN